MVSVVTVMGVFAAVLPTCASDLIVGGEGSPLYTSRRPSLAPQPAGYVGVFILFFVGFNVSMLFSCCMFFD